MMDGQMTLTGHAYLRFSRGDVRFSICEQVDGLTMDQLDKLARWAEEWEQEVREIAVEEYCDSQGHQDDINDSHRVGHDIGWDDAMRKAEDMIEVLFDDLTDAIDAYGDDGDDTYDALHSRIDKIIESRKARLETL